MNEILLGLFILLQTVSVAVSVLTLTFISVDRWYAICFPLKFKSTTTRAKISIIIIWITSLTIGECNFSTVVYFNELLTSGGSVFRHFVFVS